MAETINSHPSTGNDKEYHPSSGFLHFLDEKIIFLEGIHRDLEDKKVEHFYKTLEDQFIAVRREFKDKLQLISNPDYLFLTHAESRRGYTQNIIDYLTKIAKQFEQAKENNRLDVTTTKDLIEDLINAIKNLKERSINP